MQACCRWHPIDALVVVVRSRWVQACRCDAVDAPPRCGKSDLVVVLPRRRRVQPGIRHKCARPRRRVARHGLRRPLRRRRPLRQRRGARRAGGRHGTGKTTRTCCRSLLQRRLQLLQCYLKNLGAYQSRRAGARTCDGGQRRAGSSQWRRRLRLRLPGLRRRRLRGPRVCYCREAADRRIRPGRLARRATPREDVRRRRRPRLLRPWLSHRV